MVSHKISIGYRHLLVAHRVTVRRAALFGLSVLGIVSILIASLLASGVAPDLRLVDAAKAGDKKAVAALLKEKVDVNATQPGGATALAWAAERANDEIARLLLAAGAKPDIANDYGETPLTLACANGDGLLVQQLIDAGANARAARWNGETALMICAGNGNPSAVRLLLAHGADTAATDQSKGQNALMWAAAQGQSQVVKILVEHGADVNAASKGNFTPIMFAAEKGDADSIKVLVAAGADVNKALPDGSNPIMIASNLKQPAAVTALLETGAKPTVADRTGNTPLHSAAQAGDADLVKLLVAKGADPNARTVATAASGRGGFGGGFGRGGPSGQQTPLMLAAKAGKLDAMKALVEGGANPKLKAQDDTTLLMAAAGSGHVEVVKYAFELDPTTVQSTNKTGNNAVHASVTGTGGLVPQKSICEVIQFLADKGVDVDVMNAQGRTAISIANGLPIDTAVDLMVALLEKAHRTPRLSPKR
jgi:uncharacterized protein